MNDELKEIYVKQMLLSKEELVLQVMELMADKMSVEKQLADIKFYIEQSDIKNMLWGKEILKIINKE